MPRAPHPVPQALAAPRAVAIRGALRATLTHHPTAPGALVVPELGLDRSCVFADLAVLGPEFHGFEIKSDADSLTRLPAQVHHYSRVFCRATLVVGMRHVDAAAALLPEWWGVTLALPAIAGAAPAGAAARLVLHRSPAPNPRVDPTAVANLLWRDEALAALAVRGLGAGLRSKPRRALADRLASLVPLPELRALVRDALRARARWRDVAGRTIPRDGPDGQEETQGTGGRHEMYGRHAAPDRRAPDA